MLLAVALVVSGVLVVGLTRASLVDQLDDELLRAARVRRPTRVGPGGPAGADPTGPAVRARSRLDRRGNVVRVAPVGLRRRPDPLPDLPVYPDGIPAVAFGRHRAAPAVDGSLQLPRR